jgi:PEGA domain
VAAPAAVAPANASSGPDRRATSADQFSSSLANARPRGDRPATGVATARQPFGGGGGGDDFVSFPFYGPWGNWYPWYTPGFGWYAGYMGYNPWYYGATCWSWGIYGPWYNPYSYCWGSYYWPPASSYYGVEIGGGGGGAPRPQKTTGEVRVLASPKDAKVYIDNALVGEVDEFDGLNSHLEIEGGRRTLTLKADGYVTYTKEILVELGRTVTVRVTMKKSK